MVLAMKGRDLNLNLIQISLAVHMDRKSVKIVQYGVLIVVVASNSLLQRVAVLVLCLYFLVVVVY